MGITSVRTIGLQGTENPIVKGSCADSPASGPRAKTEVCKSTYTRNEEDPLTNLKESAGKTGTCRNSLQGLKGFWVPFL